MSLSEVEFQAKTVEETAAPAIQGRSQWWLTWRRLRHDRAAVASMIVIVIVALAAILAPLFAHLIGHGVATQYTNTGISSAGTPVSPGTNGFRLGTDELGRDLFVRIIYGAQISLFVGLVTTFIGTVAGVSIGLISGYFGGAVDAVLARLVDSVLAFPYIVLALSLAVVFGPSLPIVIAVISFFAWAGIARVVRGQVLSIREKEYIEAARSLGAGPWRIMFIDILPNLLAPVLVLATLSIPAAIVFEATLDYLGLGVQPPTASWGNILAGAQSYYQVAWWYLVFPAIALVITTIAFNLLGDGVRDAMDPRTERIFAAGRRKRRRRRARAQPALASAGADGGQPRFPDPPHQPMPPMSN